MPAVFRRECVFLAFGAQYIYANLYQNVRVDFLFFIHLANIKCDDLPCKVSILTICLNLMPMFLKFAKKELLNS